jgi:hypothetical protein
VAGMTDNAERKVREWAKGRNGDPLTNKDVVDLVLAVDADGDARHVETIGRLDDVDERHISLCLRVSELETVSVGCSERVKAFVASEHDVRHTEHMASHHGPERRADDPPDSAFLEKRLSAFPEDSEMGDLRRAWRTLRWFALAFGLIFVDMFARYLSHTLFGYSS